MFEYLSSEEAQKPLAEVTNTPAPAPQPKRRGRPPKEKVTGSTAIIKGNEKKPDEVEVVSGTIDSYEETNQMLRTTIGQIDQLACELKQEMDNVRASKAMKGRYQYISNFMESMGSMLSTKIQAVKELNNSIKSSNELDYKKQKDSNELNGQNNDAIIQGLYNSFISNPQNQGMAGREMLGPSMQQMTISGSTGIVGAGYNDDAGYQNFMNNITPDMNRMILENDPNIKEVVVFDQATGQKRFDVINTATGQFVPNVPHLDNMFLEDTTIDVDKCVARNINLNKSWQVIILNQGAQPFEY